MTRPLGWLDPARYGRPHVGRLTATPAALRTLPQRVTLAHLPPVYDQGAVGCHDATTEVLTDRGWTRWDDYDRKALLGTMNPATHALEFQSPLDVQAYDYDGPLHVSEHKSLDFALTPNHRMLVRPWNERARTLSDAFEFRRIDEVGWYAGLPASTSGFVGGEMEEFRVGDRTYAGDDFIALVALVASDGWVGGTESNKNTVSFCCFRDDRLDMVRDLARRLALHEVPSRPGVWKWADGALAEWFRASLYTGDVYRSPFKRVPDVVKSVSGRQVEHFLRFYGDQHVSAQDRRQFFTSSARMAGDLQELLLRAGRQSTLYERAPRSAQMRDGRRIDAENCAADITVSEHSDNRSSLERKRNLRVEAYKGPVYCATVPNSTLVTRRNGRVLISGNSCTAQALCGAVEMLQGRAGLPQQRLDRVALYHRERRMLGTINEDSGAILADGVAVLRAGYEPERSHSTTWGPAWTADPPRRPVDAPQLVNAEPLSLDVPTIAWELASGHPVAVGVQITAQWDAPAAAIAEPRGTSRGGHAVLLVGFDQSDGTWLVRNSWGEGWGDGGYARLSWGWTEPPWCGEAHALRVVRAVAAVDVSMATEKREALRELAGGIDR